MLSVFSVEIYTFLQKRLLRASLVFNRQTSATLTPNSEGFREQVLAELIA